MPGPEWDPRGGLDVGPSLRFVWDSHQAILVGGFEHEFYDFPYIGNFIIPTDISYFSEGLKTTNQYIKLYYEVLCITRKKSHEMS